MTAMAAARAFAYCLGLKLVDQDGGEATAPQCPVVWGKRKNIQYPGYTANYVAGLIAKGKSKKGRGRIHRGGKGGGKKGGGKKGDGKKGGGGKA